MPPDAGPRRERLAVMPAIEALRLSVVTSVPQSHPEHANFQPFPVYGFLIRHPDGPIVVDTGIGHGHQLLDSLYGHESVHLVEELEAKGVDGRDIALIANSHLHFDHCGQNHALACPIAAQRAELEAAAQPGYTVQEWAAIPPERARLLDGDEWLAPGVRAIATPGHTPGHQSIVIEAGGEIVVIAAQCIFRATAWPQGTEPANAHGETWRDAAAASLRRLQALHPTKVLLSHDAPLHLARHHP